MQYCNLICNIETLLQPGFMVFETSLIIALEIRIKC